METEIYIVRDYDNSMEIVTGPSGQDLNELFVEFEKMPFEHTSSRAAQFARWLVAIKKWKFVEVPTITIEEIPHVPLTPEERKERAIKLSESLRKEHLDRSKLHFEIATLVEEGKISLMNAFILSKGVPYEYQHHFKDIAQACSSSYLQEKVEDWNNRRLVL